MFLIIKHIKEGTLVVVLNFSIFCLHMFGLFMAVIMAEIYI